MVVGIYVRVSTTAQANDGESIESQKRYGIEFCESNDHTYKIFEDGGISGANIDKRLGYQDLLDSISTKEIDIVWTFSTSRLNRDIANQTILFSHCQKNGVRLFVGNQEYDFDNPQDKLMLSVLSIFDDYFRAQNTHAIVKGKQRLLTDGKWVTGTTLFGYDVIDDGYKIVINEKEKEVLNRMVDWAIDGMSYSDISKQLKLEYGDEIDRDNKVYKWTDSFVHRLFHKNYFMKGYFDYSVKGVSNRFEFPPIVDKERYDKAVLLLGITAKTKRTELVTYLEGHVVCGECGGNLTASRQWGKVRKDGSRELYYYWRCHRKKRDMCRKISIKTAIVEDDIDFILKTMLEDRKFLEEDLSFKIQEKYRDYYKNREGIDDKKIHIKISKERDKLNRLKELYVEGEISRDKYNSHKRDIEGLIIDFEKQLTPSASLEEEDYLNVIKMFKEISQLNKLDTEEFFKKYIDKVVIGVAEYESAYQKKFSYRFIWKGLGGDGDLATKPYSGRTSNNPPPDSNSKSIIGSSASLTTRDPKTFCLRVLFFSEVQVSMKQPVISKSRWMFDIL